MLPRNIDLTEHGDFMPMQGFHDPLMHVSYQIEYKMTPDEYGLWVIMERFFGKRMYENRKWTLFGAHRLEKELKDHCGRCGKELRCPWKRLYFGLCKECDDILRYESNYDRFPWYPAKRVSDNRNPKEIFQLR